MPLACCARGHLPPSTPLVTPLAWKTAVKTKDERGGDCTVVLLALFDDDDVCLFCMLLKRWSRVCTLAGTHTSTPVRRTSSASDTSAAAAALNRITSAPSPRNWPMSAATCRLRPTNTPRGEAVSRCTRSRGSEPGNCQRNAVYGRYTLAMLDTRVVGRLSMSTCPCPVHTGV